MQVNIKIRSTNLENIKAGELRPKFSAAGDRILRYYIDFRHIALDLHKEVSAPEIGILQNKVDALMASWDKKYAEHVKRADIAAGKELAEELAIEAEARRQQLSSILKYTLEVDDAVDWGVLKDDSKYSQKPFPKPKPLATKPIPIPQPPQIGFLQKIFGQRKSVEAAYAARLASIEKENEKLAQKDAEILSQWKQEKEVWDAEETEQKEAFLRAQKETNDKVDVLKAQWNDGEPEAILEHASIVLDASEYDDLITKEFDLQYDEAVKTLLIEYTLPSPEDLPAIKTVRFVAATGELKETQISAKDRKALYDEVCYQLCLRSIHEVLEADIHGHIEKVVFNGVTNAIDRATGRRTHSTILSLMVAREEFLSIQLSHIDPKTCFKSLKGVSAASLAGLSPIAPIMELNKSDHRFVEARSTGVADDGSTNLAAMDWEEFEHLVRELFDKEFASRGGEVKITQSSSDGGVDAVAFDPDPISGGKIVIQAKRYTKTVGVAAVRDLYGTTLNEGANKGILVTTADYGPDAYKFIADKPLTLMTGANLLHLLSKHGIKAKIDVAEARKELGLNS